MRGLKVGALHALNVTLCTKIASRATQTQGRVEMRSDLCSRRLPFLNAQFGGGNSLGCFGRDLSSQRLISGRLLFGRQSCMDSRFVVKKKRIGIVAAATRDFTGLGRKKAAPKTKTHWVCEDCGESYAQWWGQCRNCKAMNSLKEFKEAAGNAGKRGGAGARAVENLVLSQANVAVKKSPRAGGRAWLEDVGGGPQRLSDVTKAHSQLHWRLPLGGDTGQEIGRVLGGGLVPGSLILVGGDPGVGKSTLLLQVAGLIAEGSGEQGPSPVLYVSGEESVEQISNRADRLEIRAHELFLYSATDLELVIEAIAEIHPRAVIVDSIQTVYLAEANGSAGSVSQVRECATALLRVAKQTKVPIFLVGHVTKGGDIAGPKILEHVVDVVLYMEGERLQSHRLLRVVKNRYGSTDEVGVFEMVQEGLAAVASPSELFLSARNQDSTNAASAAVAVTMEGSRPILLEVQALCSSVGQQSGRRTANGVDAQRLSLLLAVLVKQAGLKLSNQDVFINVVGGLQLREPAADVAIAVAICSSYLEQAVDREMAFVGEIGLGGELRSVGQMERRLLEAAKLGFKKCVVPKSAAKSFKTAVGAGFITIPCADVKEVIERLFLRN